MERESTKHGGRLDDEMKGETRPMTTGAPVEGHTRDDRAQDDMPEDAALVEGTWRGEVRRGSAPDPAAVEIRAELARRLSPLEWPAGRDAVLGCLRSTDLPPGLAAVVERIPERTYDRFQAVWEAVEDSAAA